MAASFWRFTCLLECAAAVSVVATSAMASSAFATDPGEARQDGDQVIVDRTGALVEPWVRIVQCDSQSECRTVIYNSETREVASIGDTRMSGFEPTDDGDELVRRSFDEER